MKKRILSVVLSLCLCLLMIPAGITAGAAPGMMDMRDAPPHIYSGSYDPATTVMTVTFSTQDVGSRYFESYLLTTENINSQMGTITINRVRYQIWGIMSFDRDDPSHVKVVRQEDTGLATVTLSQETYFAGNEPPAVGDTVFFAVQTEGSHEEEEWGGGSDYSDVFEYHIPPTGTGVPPAPVNVRAFVRSMQYGKMMVDGIGSLTGNVATIALTFDKPFGWNHFFVSPVRSNLSKVASGNMPFIHNYNGCPGWEPGSAAPNADDGDPKGELLFEGPNGEVITQTPDTYTVEVKVLTCEEFPAEFPYGYVTGENIILCAATMNSDSTAMSDLVTIEIPFEESSVGQTFEPFVPEPLENTSVISAEEIVKGESVTVTASATGGYGDYEYNVLCKKSTAKNFTTVSSYGGPSEVTIKLTLSGEYKIVVRAKDAKGNIARKSFIVKVNGLLKNVSVLSAEEIVKGDTVTVTAAAEGGMGGYQYSVLFKKETSKSYSVASKFSEQNVVTIKPASTGVYDILVKVKDKTGRAVSKSFKLTVNGLLKNTSTLSADTIVKGQTVTVYASASGGMGGYQYSVLYKKSTSSGYTVASSFSENNEVTIKPGSAVSYEIVVKVKDGTGKVVRKSIPLTVTKA